jgi:hypothetical protein
MATGVPKRVARERRLLDWKGVPMLDVRSRPGLGEVLENFRENSPKGQTIQLDKPMAKTEAEGHIGLVRTKWMTKVRI